MTAPISTAVISLDDLDTQATTDLGTAVFIATVLDIRLGELIKSRFTAADQLDLLAPFRTLYDLDSKIRFLRVVGVIEDDIGDDLDTVKAIRNDFVHRGQLAMTFDDERIINRISKLNQNGELSPVGDDALWEGLRPAEKFHHAGAALIEFIGELAKLPNDDGDG